MNQVIQYGPWTGGVDYSRPAVDLPPETLTSMSDTEILDSGAVTDRAGYDEHISTAITGTPSVTGCGKHRFSASASRVFAFAGTSFWEDHSGTWTDRGSAVTVTADKYWVTANAAGTLIGCNGNGVNAPIKWTAAAGNAAALDVDSRFTSAGTCVFWDNRAWFGNTAGGTGAEDKTFYSDSVDIETWGVNNFFLTDGPVTALMPLKTTLAIHNADGIWSVYPTGSSDTPYSRQHQSTFGAISARSITNDLLGNQLFIREDGVYEWNGSGEPQKLRGLDGDRFWNRVDLDNLAGACHAVTDAKKNFCLFFLPLATAAGGSQATVSNAIVWDFRNRRWMGPWTFAFGSSAYFNNLVHGGGYSDGDVYKTNTGTNDNGSVIDASFRTASTAPGGIAQKNRWILARHEFEKQDTSYEVRVQAVSTETVAKTDLVSVGDPSDALVTAFTIGVSSIRSAAIADSTTTTLLGYSNAMQLRYDNSQADEPFTIRKTVLVYQPVGIEEKPEMGIVV